MSRPTLFQPQRHISALDGVRGLAIIGVLGIHMMYLDAIPQPPPRYLSAVHIFQLGWMGVDLFFVLSGFLITGILLDTKLSSNYFRVFYMRRALRIFPLYYGIIAVLLVASPWLLHTRWASSVPDHSYWIVYATYFQSWWLGLHREAHAGLLADFWSLGVEEQFYLFWPFLVYFLSKKNFTRLCLSFCVLCPLFRWSAMYVAHDGSSRIAFASTAARMDTLIWGALAALLVRTPLAFQRAQPFIKPAMLLSGIGILAIAFPLHEFYQHGFWTQSAGYTLNAVFFTGFLLLAYISDAERGRLASWLDLPVLRSFGRYSYAIYVLHAVILHAVIVYLKPQPWYGKSLASGSMLFLGFFVLCWTIGFLSFFLYERHFLHLKKFFRADQPNAAHSRAT